MNEIYAKYTSKIFNNYPIKEFSEKINNCKVSMRSNNSFFEIIIVGRKKIDKLLILLAEIEELIFFYIGSFPRLISLKKNGNDIDFSNRIDKYITSNNYVRNNLLICDISSETISEEKIIKMREMKKIPLYSLQYLVSEAYDKVVTNHKMTLLLHIVEGVYLNFCDSSVTNEIQQKIYSKFPVSKSNRIGRFMVAVYWLSDNYLFRYHRKYNCNILQLLKMTKYKFISCLSDTRNWYSHFLNKDKENKLEEGQDFIICFEIVSYMLRLAVIDKISVPVIEANIQEYYYSIHDWILEVLYNKDQPLKSRTYSDYKKCQEFKNEINKLTQN